MQVVLFGRLTQVFVMELIRYYYFYQRIPLDFLQGDRFREAADSYIRPLLTKVCTNPLWYNVLPILQASKSKCDFILFPF